MVLESYTNIEPPTEDVWSIAVYGDYLYAGCWYGLAIYDISDKTAPVYIKNILGGSDTYFVAVRVYGDYLFAGVNDYSVLPNLCGVYVYDLTDPENPVKVSEEGGEDGGADEHLNYPNCIDREGNKLYVSSGWGPGLTVMDITDPTNISELGYTIDVKFDGKWSDWWLLIVRDSIVYNIIIDYYGGKYCGILIHDCTNPASIVRKGEIQGWDDARMIGSRMGQFSPTSNDYVLIGTNTGLITVDITDLDNPSISTAFSTTPTTYDSEKVFCIEGSDAYIVGSDSGTYDDNIYLTKLDVSDPLNITQGDTISSLDSMSCGDGTEEIIIDGNYIYLVTFAQPYLWIFSDVSTFAISGNVTNSLGQNLEDVKVALTDDVNYETSTDSNGDYSQTVDPDIFDVVASIPGNADQSAIVDATASDQTQDFIFSITTAPHDKGIKLTERYLLRLR